jgi:predicted RNA binding protein YcfA (HicA-like mRNA interferase family)
MSERLPVVSGRQMIRILERLGYQVSRRRGSHVRLRHPDSKRCRPTTVPLHRELTRGTLLDILSDAGMTVEQLRAVL